jgi:hypothetical protein
LVDFLAHPPSARQVGKLNFYLETLDRDVRKAHEHPSTRFSRWAARGVLKAVFEHLAKDAPDYLLFHLAFTSLGAASRMLP